MEFNFKIVKELNRIKTKMKKKVTHVCAKVCLRFKRDRFKIQKKRGLYYNKNC